MSRPALALIAAVPRNRAIGRGGELIFHESEDQKHFRRVTMGCPVIMGRKTWDSLPPRFRPLPGPPQHRRHAQCAVVGRGRRARGLAATKP